MFDLIFTIYDSQSESFCNPMYFVHKGHAVRAFTEAVNDSKTMYARYPSAFTMFHIGQFDRSTGLITLLPSPVSIGNAVEFVNSSSSTIVPLSQSA